MKNQTINQEMGNPLILALRIEDLENKYFEHLKFKHLTDTSNRPLCKLVHDCREKSKGDTSIMIATKIYDTLNEHYEELEYEVQMMIVQDLWNIISDH